MTRHVYFQPNAPDPIHSDDVVLSFVRKHVPSARAVTSIDESGGEARTYAIDDNIILKVQRPQQLRPLTSLEKEAFFLNQLESVEHVNVPRVLGYGKEGSIEYTVMTRIPGVAVMNTTLEGETRKKTLFELGKTLRRIHSLPQDPFQASRMFPGDTNFAEVKARFQESFQELVERIQDQNVKWTLPNTPEQVMEKALQTLPESDERVALHSNPGPTHTFIGDSTRLFSGLIDFGDAYISHPALDLWRWNLSEDRQSVLAGYTTDQKIDETFLATLKVVMILSDMMAIAYQTKTNDESEADLKNLLEQL